MYYADVLITGETGHKVYGNSVLSSQFFCKPKTILKKLSLLK